MSLYLKYRPQDFKSLVGQGFIKETLKKAIAQDKTVGAYLFTGPRGTGKTSTARIFAKAINCTNNNSGDPCLKCDICTGFHENKLIDIIEIDAASHTGVDNIREIIEKAQFQPTKTRYKIYIIDEVHMLSKGAFNALLKILEEPPEHVKFILATTEIHKVPETILSRCQRYDFRNHTPEDTRDRLQYIAQEEKIIIDDMSLDYIVKTSAGGLRNAISLFEQLVVDGSISYEHIEQTLGVSKQQEIQEFAQKLIESDSSVMSDFEKLETSGKNISLFFHDVLLYMGEVAKTSLQKSQDISGIITVLDTLHDTYTKAKNSFDESLTFRIWVMKILSSYTAPAPMNNPQVQTPITSKPEPQTVTTPPPTVFPETKNELLETAQDIFTPQEPEFWSEEIPIPAKSNTSLPSSGWDFEKDIFIAEVKKLWAKGAITMSLRGSDFSVNDATLSIATKTKMARNSLDTPEVLDVLHSALKAMDTPDITCVIS